MKTTSIGGKSSHEPPHGRDKSRHLSPYKTVEREEEEGGTAPVLNKMLTLKKTLINSKPKTTTHSGPLWSFWSPDHKGKTGAPCC